MAEEKKILIPGRLKNAAVGGHVAGTEDIYDDVLGRTQDEINSDIREELSEEIQRAQIKDREQDDNIEALNEQVAFEGNLEVADTAAEITDGGGKVPSVRAVSGALKGVGYFECSTAASTVNKTIAATGYSLRAGGCIKIKMINANTADNATLTVGSTAAKPLFYGEERASAGNTWEAGEVVEVYYDPSYNSNTGAFYANNVAGGSGDGAFDISKYKAVNGTPATYRTLAEALGTNGANVPFNKRKGGMTIKYIQLTDATYSLVKTEDLDTQPTGVELQSAISLADGVYTGSQLPQNITLPQNIGANTTYYLAVTETADEQEVTTYTMWVITKLTNDITVYVQWMLKNTTWSIVQSDWVGKDETPTPGSTNWVTSGGVKAALDNLSELVQELKVNDEPQTIEFLDGSGYLNNNGNFVSYGSGNKVSDFIAVTEGSKYAVSASSANFGSQFYCVWGYSSASESAATKTPFLEKKKSYIKEIITIPQGITYIRIAQIGGTPELYDTEYVSKIEKAEDEISAIDKKVDDLAPYTFYPTDIPYTIETEGYRFVNTSLSAAEGYVVTNYIPVIAGKKLHIVAAGDGNNAYYNGVWYNIDKTAVSAMTEKGLVQWNTKEITVPEGIAYIRLCSRMKECIRLYYIHEKTTAEDIVGSMYKAVSIDIENGFMNTDGTISSATDSRWKRTSVIMHKGDKFKFVVHDYSTSSGGGSFLLSDGETLIHGSTGSCQIPEVFEAPYDGTVYLQGGNGNNTPRTSFEVYKYDAEGNNSGKKSFNKAIHTCGHSFWAADGSSYTQNGLTKTRKGYQSWFKEIYDFTEFYDLKYDGHSLGAQSASDTNSIALKLSSWTGTEGDIWTLDTITNDFKKNIPLGTIDDYNSSEPNALTYYGALKIFRDKVLEISGSSAIIIVSNATHRNNGGYTSSSTNSAGCKLIDYSNALMKVAEIEGWYFVDAFNYGGIFDDNLTICTIDGLHPNNLGYKISVKPWLEQLEILYEIL